MSATIGRPVHRQLLLLSLTGVALAACSTSTPMQMSSFDLAGPMLGARNRAVFGFPEANCKSQSSPASAPLCSQTKYFVQVIPLLDSTGSKSGCAAFFPYNSLTIHTSSTGESVMVTWMIGPLPTETPTGWTASFAGINFTPMNGGTVNSPFGVNTVNLVGGNKMTLTTDSNFKSTQSYTHLPVVQFNLPGAPPRGISCVGGDPVIVNSAD